MLSHGNNRSAADLWQRRYLAGVTQFAAPVAVLLLLAITGRLTLDARVAERSHRAATESALRDYAGFASWQYSRQVVSYLRSHLSMNLAPARELRLLAGQPLPPPVILTDRARQCNCGFKDEILFAFRLDVGGGALVPDRAVAAPILRGLARHLPPAMERMAEQWAEARREGAQGERGDPLQQFTSLAFDTLGGQPYVLAYALVADHEGRARAVYGVVADPRHLRDDYARIVREGSLLPPSLVKGRPNDSLLAIHTRHPVTGTIFQTSGPLPGNALAHTDTVAGWLGGQITTVSIRPEFASTLLIGGIPASRLPLQLGMLGVAVALAVVALVQVRRTRELGRLRERFVANVSHELRTPLAHISMLSETLMLGRERSEDERRHFASVVYREAGRLTTLVESVLRFSRSQVEASRVTPEQRDVARDIEDSVEAFGALARAADVAIDVKVAPGLVMLADPAAFRQIMLNLCDNAVKFGPRAARIVIDAQAQNGAVVVSVTDQGRGIPERDRRRIFDAYVRLEQQGAASVAGAGIGLSVVRDLVTAHGGRVWVDTPPEGAGNRVAFTLPRAEP